MRSHSNTISTKKIRHSRPKRTGQNQTPAGRDLWTLFSATDRPKAHIQARSCEPLEHRGTSGHRKFKSNNKLPVQAHYPFTSQVSGSASRTRDSEGHSTTYPENTRTSYQYLHKHSSTKTVPSSSNRLGESR